MSTLPGLGYEFVFIQVLIATAVVEHRFVGRCGIGHTAVLHGAIRNSLGYTLEGRSRTEERVGQHRRHEHRHAKLVLRAVIWVGEPAIRMKLEGRQGDQHSYRCTVGSRISAMLVVKVFGS